MRLRRLGSWLAALVLSCSPQRDASDGRVTTVTTPAAPSARTADASVPTATTPASAVPAATTAPAVSSVERERPVRQGTPGSTKGTIACGSLRCSASAEGCYWDEATFAWACRPAKPVDPMDAWAEDLGFTCDDGTDCPNGETCCVLFPLMHREHSACVKRAEVASGCAAEVCVKGGARCPKDRTCTSTSEQREGVCETAKGPATCAGKKKCPADTPMCIVAASGKLECAARDSAAFRAVSGEQRFECTRQDDCHAGDMCQFVFGEIEHEVQTFCGKYNGGFMGTLVCDPTGPSLCGKDAECLRTYTCSGGGAVMPWLGGWVTK